MINPIDKPSASSTKTTQAMLAGVAVTPLQWSVSFPWLRGDLEVRLGNGIRLLGLFLLVIASVIVITGKGYLAIGVSFFILVITGYIFVPATYRIDGSGIERRTLGRRQFKPWSEFESAQTNDLFLWLYPKEKLLSGRYRTTLRIPLCKRGGTSCEKLQRVIPLRVQYVVSEQPRSTRTIR